MIDNNHKTADQEEYGRERDALDRELDAALAKYVAVEPRMGLEERVLTHLRAERGTAAPTWWQWPAIVALASAVAIVLGVSLLWKSAKPAPEVAVHHPPTVVQSGPQSPKNTPNPARLSSTMKKVITRDRRRQSIAVAGPKLEQFPSPRPLSEQEKILERYVTNDLQQATLIARARTEALGRDAAEEMSYSVAGSEKNSQ
jgi:hypothetical protein